MLFLGDVALGLKRGVWGVQERTLLCNLEGPVVPPHMSLAPGIKAGPVLSSTSLPRVDGPTVFNLANNHTMDYGSAGLSATQEAINGAGGDCVGAGSDINQAREPLIVGEKGLRIGIIGCCEAQFGVATHGRPGVAEVGPWVYQVIRRLRGKVDAIVVSMHVAVEMSPWPSPRLQELCRSLVDAGATVVHGHHAHVPRGCEEYGTGLIMYGLGNALVDPALWRDEPNTLWSLAVDVNLSSERMTFRTLTLEIQETQRSGQVLLAAMESPSDARESHEAYLATCTAPLHDAGLLRGLWQETAVRCYSAFYRDYLRPPCGEADVSAGYFQTVKRAVRNLARAAARHAPRPTALREDYLLWYHLFACMSHREAIAEALGVLSGELPDLRTEETARLADEFMPWSRKHKAARPE